MYAAASAPSSEAAKKTLEKVVERAAYMPRGKQIKIVNDNGSENMKNAETYLASIGVQQYWTHPYAPKEKPFVERFIGTLQKECLDYNYTPLNVTGIYAASCAKSLMIGL